MRIGHGPALVAERNLSLGDSGADRRPGAATDRGSNPVYAQWAVGSRGPPVRAETSSMSCARGCEANSVRTLPQQE